MDYIDELYKNNKWYLAHEILYIETDEPAQQESFSVWENLILINADSPEAAFEKAMKNGWQSEGYITINGISGHLKFKGLKNLVLIYDELEDGAELEWMVHTLNKEELERMIKTKQDMHAFTLKEKFAESEKALENNEL